MQHPVFMAFFMNHLDPEEQSAIRRWSIRFAVVCGALSLFLLGAVAAGINFAAPQVEAIIDINCRHGFIAHDQGCAEPARSAP